MKPDAEVIRKSEWYVGGCDIDRARLMIVNHHYAAGVSKTVTALHGLYRKCDDQLMGVAWWIPPTRDAASAWWKEPNEVLNLSRMVILPDTPKNAATFFLSRSVRLIEPRWRCLTTYADTWRGHDGTIYRASGWEYLGLTKPERTYVKDGRMMSRKTGSHTYTHQEMISRGAELIGSFAKHRFRFVRPVRRQAKRNVLDLKQGELF